MNHETRIGYLCYQAARNQLTREEDCELKGYIAIDPEVTDLIELEKLLMELEDK